MWPFKKPIIEIECCLPDMLREDQEYLCQGILEDLEDEYGFCYDIRLKISRENKVTILNGRKSKSIEERAIRIQIYRRINYLK